MSIEEILLEAEKTGQRIDVINRVTILRKNNSTLTLEEAFDIAYGQILKQRTS
jgi:hypothetical protein